MTLHRVWLRRYQRVFGLRGIYYCICAERLHQRTTIHHKFSGYREPVALRLGTSDIGFADEVLVRQVYEVPLTKSPTVIIDAGANIGLTSVYFANRYPAARILALEPEKSNFALLCQNVAAYPQITPLQVALWDQITDLELVGPWGRHGAFRTRDREPKSSLPVLGQVAAITIPHLMAEFELDFVDLLKVDIEGAEREVFADADAWIGRVRVIVAELHDRFRRGCALSFYRATKDFDMEWHKGEHVTVARSGWLQASTTLPGRLS